MEDVIRSYIDQYEDEKADILASVYQTIKVVLPDEEERINWGMPTFGNNIIHFAGVKHHVGIYPGVEAIKHFSDTLDEKKFKYSKGAIQMPYSKVDLSLVSQITIWCRENK